jgi:hypothetical protein
VGVDVSAAGESYRALAQAEGGAGGVREAEGFLCLGGGGEVRCERWGRVLSVAREWALVRK